MNKPIEIQLCEIIKAAVDKQPEHIRELQYNPGFFTRYLRELEPTLDLLEHFASVPIFQSLPPPNTGRLFDHHHPIRP